MKKNLFQIWDSKREEQPRGHLQKTQDDEHPQFIDIQFIFKDQLKNHTPQTAPNNQGQIDREAIVRQLLVKFDSTLRDGPLLMSTDRIQKHKIEGELSTFRQQRKVQSSSQRDPTEKIAVEDFGMGLAVAVSAWEQEEPVMSSQQRINLLRNTLSSAREEHYDRVAYDIFTKQPVQETTELNFNFHNFRNMIDLTIYCNLRILRLNHNNFKRITDPGRLPRLQLLDLSHNSIPKIQNIASYQNLRELYLDSNLIKRITALQPLVKLHTLGLSYNLIAKIEGLGTLHSLRKLDMAGNCLIKIENIEELAGLESANFAANKIESMGDLSDLPKLREVNIANNSIRSLAGVRLPKSLDTIYLTGNPIELDQHSSIIKGFADRQVTVKL